VTVLPSNQKVVPGETFEFNIFIDPLGMNIAGLQLDFAFNKSLLKVNNITEGSLFKQNGANTFFNNGVVNDSLGTVINIFDVILGKTNVSIPGIFIVINMTALDYSGSSGIDISNVKICDPDGIPVALNVTNGSIIVIRTASSIIPLASVSNLKNISYASNYINWTWTDPLNPDFAKVMIYLNAAFQSNVTNGTQHYNVTVTPGTYTIGARTVDTNGNVNATMVMHTASTILPPIRFINGTVIDSVNKMGIAGVKVFTNSLSTTTNATGFYSFAGTEGTYNISATSDIIYYTNTTTVSTIGSTVVIQDIDLVKKPTGTISGSVTS
jgi:hypothetical protein